MENLKRKSQLEASDGNGHIKRVCTEEVYSQTLQNFERLVLKPLKSNDTQISASKPSAFQPDWMNILPPEVLERILESFNGQFLLENVAVVWPRILDLNYMWRNFCDEECEDAHIDQMARDRIAKSHQVTEFVNNKMEIKIKYSGVYRDLISIRDSMEF